MSFLECLDLLGDHKAIGWGFFGAAAAVAVMTLVDWLRSRRGRA